MNRYFLPKVIILIHCLLFSAGFSGGVKANTATEQPLANDTSINAFASLIDAETRVFENPWSTYLSLKELEPILKDQSQEHQAWWLVRKGQAEHLLYYFDALEKTLAQLAKYADGKSPQIDTYYYYYLGLSFIDKAEYSTAREFLKKAMVIAAEHELNYLYIRAKLELAYTYGLSDLYETSLNDMQEAYVKAFALGDHFLIATINETYGAIYGYMQQFERSIEFYEKSLNTYKNLRYKSHIAEAVYGMATTYRYWGKYDKAIEHFERYQQLVSYTRSNHLTYFSAYGVGMTLAEKGDCEQAIKVIEKAFTLNGTKDFDVELYKRKASCHIQLNQLEQAAQSIEKAKEIFRSLPDLTGTAWQLEVIKISGELAFAQGEYRIGYQLINDYYASYANLLIENSTSRVNNIQAAMELERQEVEKALSSQRDRAVALERESKQSQELLKNYFIIFLVTLLTIVVGVVVVQRKSNIKMAAITISDNLCEIYNRRYTFEYLQKILATMRGEHAHTSVVIFDIDNFKQVNDSYGHPIGDVVLRNIALKAMESLRAGDIVGRIGGEEFMCVLPRAEAREALEIAERIRALIAAQVFLSDDGNEFTVTASFGVSSSVKKDYDEHTLYFQADKALYQAKHKGKNRVELFENRDESQATS